MTVRQDGYSIAEMLVVVAIIGLLTLVSVPAFMSLRNTNKVRSSVRNFVSDVRAARQLAISTGRETRLGFTTGASGTRFYKLYQGDRPFGDVPAANWTPLPFSRGNRALEDIVYFPTKSNATPQDFTDYDQDGDLDLVFFPDGGVRMPSTATSATITLQTDMKIYKPKYQVIIYPSGRVTTQ